MSGVEEYGSVCVPNWWTGVGKAKHQQKGSSPKHLGGTRLGGRVSASSTEWEEGWLRTVLNYLKHFGGSGWLALCRPRKQTGGWFRKADLSSRPEKAVLLRAARTFPGVQCTLKHLKNTALAGQETAGLPCIFFHLTKPMHACSHKSDQTVPWPHISRQFVLLVWCVSLLYLLPLCAHKCIHING